MGKKQPLAAVQKQRAGVDITRFLARKEPGGANAESGAVAEAPSGTQHVAGVRPPGSYAHTRTPGKHLLENVCLSQEVDDGGMQVVWASSPAAGFSPQKGAGTSQDTAASGGAHRWDEGSQGSRGLQQALLDAMQVAGSEAEPAAAAAAAAGLAASVCGTAAAGNPQAAFLERLLARRLNPRSSLAAAAGGSATTAAPDPHGSGAAMLPPPPQALQVRPAPEHADMDEQVMQEVLAGTDTFQTPTAAKLARCKPPSTTSRSAEGRPVLCTPSALSLGHRPMLASSRKTVAGTKRRALLDLLDQVEFMVKHRGPGERMADAPTLRDTAGPASGAAPLQREAGPAPRCARQTPSADPMHVGSASCRGGPVPDPPAEGATGAACAPLPGDPLTSGTRLAQGGGAAAAGPKGALPDVAATRSSLMGPSVAAGGPSCVPTPGAGEPTLPSSNPCSASSIGASSARWRPPCGPGTCSGSAALYCGAARAPGPASCAAAAYSSALPAAQPARATFSDAGAAGAAPPQPAGTAAGVVEPAPIVLRPPTAAATQAQAPANDDDDEFDFDVDAIVAGATRHAPSGAASSSGSAPCGALQPSAPQLPARGEAAPTRAAWSAPRAGPPTQQLQGGCGSGATAAHPPLPPPPAQPQPRPPRVQHTQPAPTRTAPAPPSWQPSGPPAPAAPTPAASMQDPQHQQHQPQQQQQQRVEVAPPLAADRQEVHHVVLEVDCSRHDRRMLRCFNEYKGQEVHVCLLDGWAEQPPLQPGDPINIVGGRTLPGQGVPTVELNSQTGLLILHPDVLLSGTTITDAMRCQRKAWLHARGARSGGSKAALLGIMSHDLLQRIMLAALDGTVCKERVLEEAKAVVSECSDKLLEADYPDAEAQEELSKMAGGLAAWCSSYLTCNPAAPLGGRVEMHTRGVRGLDVLPTFCRVDEVLDIEENIWAPKYGLKGQLDATLRVTLSTQDPLHNQRTLHGGHASALQRQNSMQGRGERPAEQAAAVGAGQPALARSFSCGSQPHGAVAAAAAAAGAAQGPPQASTRLWQPQQPPPLHQQHGWAVGGPGPPGPGQAQRPGVHSETMVVPFEFKSGRAQQSHRAQVLLYLLLMEERYRTAVRTGLLWTSSGGAAMDAVQYAHDELVGILNYRNRLAAYLVGTASEPPPPHPDDGDAERACGICNYSATCALYLAAERGRQQAAAAAAAGAPGTGGAGGGLGGGVSSVVAQQAEEIPAAHAAFFAHWVRLVDLEEQRARAGGINMWAMTGPQREQLGACLARLVLERELPPQTDESGTQRSNYVFRRLPSHDAGSAAAAPSASAAANTGAAASEDGDGGGLLLAGFAPGDMALLGVEGRHVAAARVDVVAVSKECITLSCRKQLRLATFCGGGSYSGSGGPAPAVTWRLDKDEAASTYGQMRNNLAMLCVRGVGVEWTKRGGQVGGGGKGTQRESHVEVARATREANLRRLRELVIGLAPPQQGVVPGSLASQLASAGGGSSQRQHGGSAYLARHAAELNGEQLEAVQRVLAMQDYAVLLGMPGTGKTTTIVHIIRTLVELGQSVLVSAYTNSAVDNILLKLVDGPVDFVRLGTFSSTHPRVRAYRPGGARHPDTSAAGLQTLMSHVKVVGCTCLSVNSPLLAGKTFNACILDEASQATLPVSIGALALARTFLLVGDHYQLSPLVTCREAAQGGLDVSLFRRLSEANPQAVVTLTSQYRMATEVMALSNALIYNGRLRCGNEQVARAMLHLPHLHLLRPTSHAGTAAQQQEQQQAPGAHCYPPWLLDALRPQARVVFLDTDTAAGCCEVALQEGTVNPGEGRIVCALAGALMAAGLPAGDIGVISPYKAQVIALQRALVGLGAAAGDEAGGGGSSGEGGAGGGAVEVLTIDKSQGRDKAAVLLTFVRHNTACSAGKLLADWQRLNVAITRARAKLVMVGSASTLSSIPILADMLALLRRNGWVAALPVKCLEGLPPAGAGAAPAALAGVAAAGGAPTGTAAGC